MADDIIKGWMQPLTIPTPRSDDASRPASDVVCLELEGAAYVAACRAVTIELSERESDPRDIPAARPGRYCIVPPPLEAA